MGGLQHSPWTWAAEQRRCHTRWHIPCTAVRNNIVCFFKQLIYTDFISFLHFKEKYALKLLPSCGVLTIEDKAGPSRSHWFSIFSMRESTNEEFCFASAWASVRNLMQSWHTSSFSYRKGKIQGRMKNKWRTYCCCSMWVHKKFKRCTFFGVSCWGASFLGLSWG